MTAHLCEPAAKGGTSLRYDPGRCEQRARVTRRIRAATTSLKTSRSRNGDESCRAPVTTFSSPCYRYHSAETRSVVAAPPLSLHGLHPETHRGKSPGRPGTAPLRTRSPTGEFRRIRRRPNGRRSLAAADSARAPVRRRFLE